MKELVVEVYADITDSIQMISTSIQDESYMRDGVLISCYTRHTRAYVDRNININKPINFIINGELFVATGYYAVNGAIGICDFLYIRDLTSEDLK